MHYGKALTSWGKEQDPLVGASPLRKVGRQVKGALQGPHGITDHRGKSKQNGLPLPLPYHPLHPSHPGRRGVCHHRWLLSRHLDTEEKPAACRVGGGPVLSSVESFRIFLPPLLFQGKWIPCCFLAGYAWGAGSEGKRMPINIFHRALSFKKS